MANDTPAAGWIACIDGRDVAGGPDREAAIRTAVCIGHALPIGYGRASFRPATAAEVNALDLPPSALGIAPGAVPWWRADPKPVPPAPEGPAERPVYHVQGDGGEPWPDWRGPVVHAWGAVRDHDRETDEPTREYLGRGYLVGWLHRERPYLDDAPYFTIRGEDRETTADVDVALPIVENEAGRFLPEYPRCPDCGGEVVWADAGRVPGSRQCDGFNCPDCGGAGDDSEVCDGCASSGAWFDGCGSTYIDTRFGYAAPVPGAAPADERESDR